MPNPQGDFIWYELMTTDPEGARRFYKDVAGLEVAAEASGDSDMDYRMISVGEDFMGGLLGLTEGMTQGGARPGWVGYIGVDDVDASVAALEEAGGSVHMPATNMEGVGRMAMVSDPDGAHFYLMRGDSDESSTVFRMMDPGHMAWNELMAKDWEAAWDFYSGLLDWQKGEALEMPGMGTYQMFTTGETSAAGPGPIGGMMTDPEGGPTRWVHYLAVPDIDVAARAVEAGGGRLVVEPMEIPGGMYSLVAADPQGAVFGLVGPREKS